MEIGSWIDMNPVFTVHDYAIGGKMVVGKTIISEEFKRMLEDGDPNAKKEIKSRLIYQMAEYMLENRLVEFTQYEDHISGSKHIAIRAYLAPDEQIKILRSATKL